MPIGSVSLDDKYALEAGAAYMSGIQALVRLPIEQMRRDRRAGLNTGCLISGYEGSPLGGYDLALERAGRFLGPHGIRFVPGVNEELALTAVMGSQLFQTFPEPLYDGAVGIWYGKGPGLDRSGDALRHANFAGIGENCGALALAGDDHISKSSSIPHQSELTLYNYAVPVLNPSNTQEMLDFGLYGIAMSRFGGSWVGLKLSTDICDGGAIVEFGAERCPVELPELLMGGEPYRKALGTMLVVPYSLSLEAEVHEHRLQAARAFARVNPLNRITVRHDADRLGIVTTGKSYADLMSALRLLGVGDADLRRSGVRILKLGMSYPLEPEIVDEFVRGLETVLVIEEKRSFVELQLREALYNRAERPAVYGKKDAAGETLLPSPGELDSGVIALALCRFLGPEASLAAGAPDPSPQALNPAGFRSARGARTPSYCSGCPHNRSTLLLEGQLAGGGIGCHGMAGLMRDVGRGIEFLFHMGSEGASWIGIAPFSGTKHLFQNLGDGTYFHSGRQAVQAAVAAGVDITFKILYNDAVAMTGGQRAVGALSVPALSRELAAQGIGRIVVLSDDPRKFKGASRLAPSAELRPREDLEAVLGELARVKGVSVMIYDQLCAAEKRRRRNRGILPQPERRIMINERVCEGCGDCVRQANCVSLLPVDTEYGPKTRVHQSSCNADYTCTWGDCPSFVLVQIERGLRGLRQAGELRVVAAGRHRVRSQDPGASIVVQRRLHLHLGRLPFVCVGSDRARERAAAQAAAGPSGTRAARACGQGAGRGWLPHPHARRGRHGRRHHQRPSRDRRAHGRVTGDHPGPDRRGAKGRRSGRAHHAQRFEDRGVAAHPSRMRRPAAGLRPCRCRLSEEPSVLRSASNRRARQFEGDPDGRGNPQGLDRAVTGRWLP
jgi:indolepyruvate ferredoxin oxidoreductase